MSRISFAKKFRLNRRGFSSIVGAIFAAIAIISLMSGMFIWSLNQNTNYNNTVRLTSQADLDRANERGLATVAAYHINNNNAAVLVNGTLQNAGPLPLTFKTLWIVDSNSNQYNYMNLSMMLKPGNITTLTGATAFTVPLTNQLGDNFTCWFISSRGNIVSQYSLVLAEAANANVTYQTINNIGGTSATYANVSEGIGLIAFDFKGFSHQDFPSQPASGTSLNNLQKTYVISQSLYTVFHVTLTNYDPAEANMYLSINSSIYLLGSHLQGQGQGQGQTVKYLTWSAVNVTGNPTSGYVVNPSNTNVNYVLPYGVPCDIFFAGIPPPFTNVDPSVYPMNILVFGRLGTSEFGQNVPYVAVQVTP